MLIDRENIVRHRGWIVFILVATIAAGVWYGIEAKGIGQLPGGASLPGLAFGIVGAVIMLFEFLLWPRKHFRRWRLGAAKTWMKAHIWLGLLTVPLILLHSGFTWGGSLSTILAALFIAVIMSGIFGLAMQQFLPRLMLTDLPAETVVSQAEHVAHTLYLDAEQTVAAICGAEPDETAAWRGEEPISIARDPNSSAVGPRFQSTDAPSPVGGSIPLDGAQTQLIEPVAGSEPLRRAFAKDIGPFLWRGDRRSALSDSNRAGTYFTQLRAALDPSVHPALAMLENYCDQRRQFDRQLRWHRWLHGWLLIHLPLSVVLIVLMFIHAYTA